MKTQYRGFDIVLDAAEEWSAQIINSSTGRTFSQRLTTPIADGSAQCLRRAQNLVDAFLALQGTSQA